MNNIQITYKIENGKIKAGTLKSGKRHMTTTQYYKGYWYMQISKLSEALKTMQGNLVYAIKGNDQVSIEIYNAAIADLENKLAFSHKILEVSY